MSAEIHMVVDHGLSLVGSEQKPFTDFVDGFRASEELMATDAELGLKGGPVTMIADIAILRSNSPEQIVSLSDEFKVGAILGAYAAKKEMR